MSTTIESLELEITSNSQSAIKGIDALTQSLGKLKGATVGKLGLKAVAKELEALNGANVQGAKDKMVTLSAAISTLSTIPKVNLSGVIKSLTNLPSAIEGLTKADMGTLFSKSQELVSALTPLSELSKSNLSGYINSLQKLPKVFKELNDVDMDAFGTKMQEIATAMKPLADEMQKVSNGFSAMPTKIQKLITETNKMPKANKKAASSFTDLYHAATVAMNTIKRIGSTIYSMVEKSMDYTENMNLFKVSMGEYASDALDNAETLRKSMGIDPSDWIRAQGIFMTMSTGFGVASDRASVMSENLTQLGYDLASFYNMDVEDSMTKLKSGLAGELEPLRAIGFDLSQAKLEATAKELGITKLVSEMTQAEKAQLRYHAILSQVTVAHGDMARTLDDPANQMRMLKSEISMAAREIGNAFIPMLKAVLPYAIALARVIGELAKGVASLLGFKESGIEDSTSKVVENTSTTTENLERAQEEAKKLKSAMTGIDELNIINPNTGDSADASGWVDFDLPTYKFTEELETSKVNEIVDKMKEWLGITEEIDSWADVFETRLGRILTSVGLVAGALLTWKLSTVLLKHIETLSIGLGAIILIDSILLTFQEGLSWESIIGGALGGALMGAGIGFKLGGFAGAIGGMIIGVGLSLVINSITSMFSEGVNLENVSALLIGAITTIGGLLTTVKLFNKSHKTGEKSMDKAADTIGEVSEGTSKLTSKLKSLVTNLALGIVIIAEVAAATLLIVGSIWLLGEMLEKVGKAWQPVLDNGETITKAILIGTGLLVGIGTVTALIGSAITSTGFTLPIAIGIGTAVLVALGIAFGLLAESLVKVARKLTEELHPALVNLNEVLPGLTRNMENFSSFMSDFAWVVVEYSVDTAIAGIATTISTVIGFFTGDPIAKMANEVKSQNTQFDKLITQLEKALSKIARATELTQQYKTAMSNYNNVSGGSGGFGGWLSNTINAIFGRSSTTEYSSLSIPMYASGGFPEQGQMFIAREAGAEMVGNIGRRTAVANNDQIVSGIAGGVAEANEEQNVLLREQNTLLRAILEKDSGVYLDGRSLSNSVEKYQRERGRVLVTGGVM